MRARNQRSDETIQAASLADAPLAVDREGVIGFPNPGAVRRLLAVPAMTKGGRRMSVEFTIQMMRDVTTKFEQTRALRQKIAALEAAQSHG